MFSDTPMSGEHLPEMEGSTSIEDHPTEMRERFATSSDTDTTERRADLSHLSMGKRPRVGNIARSIPRATTTERESRPAFEKSDTEIDDNNATLIQPPLASRAASAPPKGAPSPDDTIRMDGDATNEVRDARDRLSSTPAEPAAPARAPKRSRIHAASRRPMRPTGEVRLSL